MLSKINSIMESGFVNDFDLGSDSDWQSIPHNGSGHFEFFKVRHFGALHFVKRPTPEYRNDLVTVESLRKEFYIGYNLNHPLIVRYIRMEDDVVYEEYIDGLSLREMIDRKDERLHSSDFVRHICCQLLEATAYLHSHGVIHNDIKPENVMISRIDNRLKLVDLGCATADMWDVTEGYTPAYKAPEQGESPTNVYTDIFLIGKLIEELASKAGVARKWRRFIKRATSIEVSERFSSDKEALAAIPEVSRTKIIGFAVIVILLILSVSIWIFYSPRRITAVSAESEVVTDSVAPVSMDTVVKYVVNVEEPERTVTVHSSAVSDVIDEELEKYVIDKYNNEVFPNCRRYAEMPSSYDKVRLELQIQEIMKTVIDDVMEYAERLAEMKYPEKVEYAKMKASSLLNTQQTMAALIQYPDNKKEQSSEDVFPLDLDSLRSIKEEFRKR